MIVMRSSRAGLYHTTVPAPIARGERGKSWRLHSGLFVLLEQKLGLGQGIGIAEALEFLRRPV